MSTRAAIVTYANREALARYLPANYSVATACTNDMGNPALLITGEDHAGWTLDDYVIPRLASGLIPAYECDPDTGARL